MDTVHKLFEALLFVVLGVLFYVWQMRQIRNDRRKAAEQSARERQSAQDLAPVHDDAQQNASDPARPPPPMEGPAR